MLGVGGGGCNAVNRMYTLASPSIECWAINTDAQALRGSLCPNTLLLRPPPSHKAGFGSGGDPKVGLASAQASASLLSPLCSDADLVFVTAGLGGGTGSGAAPFVAQAARRSGCLVVGVVTTPFSFEGRKRAKQAEEAMRKLGECVDALVVVSNELLRVITPADTPLVDAFKVADDVLRQCVLGLSDAILTPGLVNVDFADVRAMLSNSGPAIIGVGTASSLRTAPPPSAGRSSGGGGKLRATTTMTPAQTAAHLALSSPLLTSPIGRCSGVLFNVVGGPGMSALDVSDVAAVVRLRARDDANVIFGAAVDKNMASGEIKVTVLATGFDKGTNTRQDDADDDDDDERLRLEQETRRRRGIVSRTTDMIRAFFR